jgi:hypothetical protein
MEPHIKPARHLIGWFLRTFKFTGITLPPWGIYLREDLMGDEELRRHESVHWAQYERMGALTYYVKYLWLSLRYGYRNNPMEVEARGANN